MFRQVKIALVFSVALWGLVGALHNVYDWDGTLGAVTAATSMSTFEGGAEKWQATSNTVVVWAGALFIFSAKLISCLFCAWGGSKMWQNRSDGAAFKQAKQLALSGCGIAIMMLFLGFVVVAESWFELWRSEVMRGPVLDSAFRYAGMIGLVALLVATED